MKIVLKARNDNYNAIGEWNGESIIVKKGSRIKVGEPGSFNQIKKVKKYWADQTIVAPDGEVLKDLTFSSLSTAAQFVTKRSVNGWIAWKTETNKSLKVLKEN